MRIRRARSTENASEVRSDTFTGTVVADSVLPAEEGAAVNQVFFLPGARTYWHSHEHGQVLHVTTGRGWVCASGSDPQSVAAGDTVWAPPGETHWHGASADTLMGHTAVSLGKTTWLEPVADSEYPADPPSEGDDR